jgi:hypothetical protein
MWESPLLEADWNRGSVADEGRHNGDTACITSSGACGALRWPQAFVTIPARKQTGSGHPQNPVQVAGTELTHQSTWRYRNHTAPLPGSGQDRMGDFERVGTANLWKSGPLFSTGPEKTELVTEELRLNLCSPARNSKTASRARSRREMVGDFDPRLSTAFAKAGGPLFPAGRSAVPS